jgi:DNA invertase Pin-like site-specific DNA recombinase
MNEKVINLLRVSTAKQDMKRQRTDVARVNAAHHHTVLRSVEIPDLSGRFVLADPDVQQVLRDLERPDVGGVCISALDRLFRPDNFGDFAILDYFRKSKKRIWSAKEGMLDPSSDSGFMMAMMGGCQAGMEWRELRRRTLQGKEELRLLGGNPDGPTSIPRGVAFDKNPDKELRRVKPGTWRYDEPDASRVKRMAELLVRGESLHTITATVGGGWTIPGVKSTLQNRIWAFGTRVYPASATRPEPLEVKVIDKPLLSIALWEAVQRELDRRKSGWRKTKKPPRFLSVGLVRCKRCGKSVYLRCGSATGTRRKRDYYYCASRHPRGPGCGAPSYQREVLDAAVERAVTECLSQPAVLRTVLDELERRTARPDQSRKQADAVARLEAKRQRILDQNADGLITREQCVQRVRTVDCELADARALVPAPLPSWDAKATALKVARAFACFAGSPFAKKRDLLRRAVRDITLADGTIPSITLMGGFLQEILGANLEAQSRRRYWRRCRAPERPRRWR